MAGTVTDISEGATHYHATYVNPYWADDMTVVLEVGQHIFYK
jgi:spore germination cell wall hydrolase CwlJ-like protein